MRRYNVIGGIPQLIGQTQDTEEAVMNDIAVPEVLGDVQNAASGLVQNRDQTIRDQSFQNGVLVSVVSTWVGAAAGRYFIDEEDGPMWGAMLGGLGSLAYAMLPNRR